MIRNALITSCLLLTACGTTNIIDKELVTAPPKPDTLYECNRVVMPDPNKLTDRQVAKLITKLVQENTNCRNALLANKAIDQGSNGIIVPQSTIDKVKGRVKAP